MPLAQNVQPTGHPTCELTHAVRRSASGIMTVSALAPSGHVSRSLSVPSLLHWDVVTEADAKLTRAPSSSRSLLERLVIPAGSATSLPYTHSRTCCARNR